MRLKQIPLAQFIRVAHHMSTSEWQPHRLFHMLLNFIDRIIHSAAGQKASCIRVVQSHCGDVEGNELRICACTPLVPTSLMYLFAVN